MLPASVTEPVYVSSPAPLLWAWGDHSSVAVWADDVSTAAFAAHLGILCRELNLLLGGLPPLTTLITLVSACQREWTEEESRRRWEFLKGTSTSKSGRTESSRTANTNASDQRVVQWLTGLHRIHSSIRSKPEMQAVWIADRLKGCRSWLLEERDQGAQEAIDWLSIADQDRTIQVRRHPTSRQRLQKGAESLIFIAREPLDIPRLESLCKLGVDALPPVQAIELPEPNPIFRFLERLTKDSDLGSVASQALSIAANFSLPRQISQPDILPMGGVSDVTNRGTPERLLMSELAVDPMLLMARIANGQALYLRREIPPHPKTQRRLVMIEHGIRTWGEGRSQLLAMALGIAVSQERRGNTDEYVTVAGENYWKENLGSRAGLEEHLQRLIPAEHPAEGIMAAHEEWMSQHQDHSAESILLLSENTFLDKRFQDSIRTLPTPFYVASIASDGSVQWLRRTRYGDEILQRFSLKLQALGDAMHREVDSIDHPNSSDLPRYLSLQPGPLGINIPLSQASWMQATQTSLGKRVWIVTNNQQLMVSFGDGNFLQEMECSLPCKQVFAWTSTDDGIRIVLGSKRGYWLVVAKNDKILPAIPLPIDRKKAIQFYFDRRFLFAFYEDQVVACDSGDGKFLAKGLSRIRRRQDGIGHWDHHGHLWFPDVVQEKIVWQDLGQTSMKPEQVQLIIRDKHSVPTLFDQLQNMERLDDISGIQPLVRRDTSSEPNMKVPLRLNTSTFDAYFHFDDRLFFSIDCQPASNSGYAYTRYPVAEVDCNGKQVGIHRYRNRDSFLINLVGEFSFYGQTPRTRIQGIASNGESLCLIGKKDGLTQIEIPTDASMLSYRGIWEDNPSRRYKRFLFGPSCSADIRGVMTAWKLRRVAMGECIAWSDSRGYLHLRAPNGQEMTLGLHENDVSIWFHGEIFGSKLAIGSDDNIVPSEGAKRFLREFAKACIQPKSPLTIP